MTGIAPPAAEAAAVPRASGLARYLRCLQGIVARELLRFVQQRGRFLAALVRPLVWLFVFAAGFRAVLGVSIMPPFRKTEISDDDLTALAAYLAPRSR